MRDLKEDHYQRTEDSRKSRLDQMKKDGWVEAKAQTIDVSERDDGSMYILDGGTRVTHARRNGVETIHARVLNGLTVDQESRLFTELNEDRSRVGIDIRFRNAYKRGDDWAVEIVEAVKRGGGTIDFEKKRRPRSTNAIGALIRVYDDMGPGPLEQAVEVLIGAWPDQSIEALRGLNIEGVAAYIRDNPKFIRDKLVNGLGLSQPDDLRLRAKDVQAKAAAKGDRTVRLTREHYRQAVAYYYSRGRVK